ncbi:M3 family peptidase [Corynebacterium poyangense]|uniref:M3 family peptidase n=1 Tax=Corynebacterium poyangense TaxID=2684405 RepID=A0A7H0SQ24_9CORY|nr:M3 family metallopeptidase [Corynebacterium poyangense]MBZ8178418.1 M3 family peptidase [Corynebacterium poyangense]QNQ90649.1 M3 family peptidase [Corynebacterium poyangense]
MTANVENNPLLKPSGMDYQFPDFRCICTDHFRSAFAEAFRRHREEIADILAQPEPTWENTVEALERSGRDLHRVSAVFFNLQGTDSDENTDAIAEDISPKLAAHVDEIYQNSQLYQRVKQCQAPKDEESQRLYDFYLRQFRRAGADLDENAQERLRRINQRLSTLSENFGRNVLADTQKFAVQVTEEEKLAGFSAADKEAARDYAQKSGKDGWVIPLELPTVQSSLAQLDDADMRQIVHQAAARRGAEQNPALAVEMVQLRAERARLLGYSSHAEYVIEEETATVDKVRDLLYDLAPTAAANAAAEDKLIAEAAGVEKISAADRPYFSNVVKQRDYQLDTAELREYFPLQQVLYDGVFRAAHRLYGIELKPRPDLPGYAEGVEVWEVLDADGTGIGLFLGDYFARPSKRGGAWMSSFVEQSELLGTKPVIVNVMGLNQTEDNNPLLSVDEVTTLFHEFGHALHGLLSKVRYPSFSGTSVPRDYVEFPSQINENWAFDPSILPHYAKHYRTGDVIPEHLVQAVKNAQEWGQGFATSEYLGAALLDFAWHSLSPEQAAAIDPTAEGVAEFEANVLAQAGLSEVLPRYRSPYFTHIFAGGYSAGYYSYLWAEVLDADGFDWFKEVSAAGADAQDDAARKAGEKFRDLVLSRGATRDFSESFIQLRGRERDLNPLLRRRGLVGTSTRSES